MNPAATPCLIFNPSAQGGRAGRFRSHPAIPGGQCVLLATSAPGDARRLAAQAVRDGFQTLIAAGGDGTANEVLNGIAEVPGGLRAVRLGILPLGTVNVFARELRLPLNTSRAWKVLALARERTIDVGRAEFTLGGLPRQRYFLQLAGAGLDSRAIELTGWNVKKKLGPLAYLLAGLKALSETRPIITVRSGQTLAGEWVAVGNGRFYGGPVPVFPRARLDDGRTIDLPMMTSTLARVLDRIQQSLGAKALDSSKFERAAELLAELAGGDFQEFLTTSAYADLA